MKKNKIFISIASYRDPELLKTIEDCISKSKSPENLVFGISRQFHPDDKFDDLTQYKNLKNFKIIETNSKDSLGVCHARSKIQSLYSNEEYYLQLDSHHRFEKNWDFTLKKYLKSLTTSKCNKPILSSYLPSYEPQGKVDAKMNDVWRTYIDRFMPEGPIFIFPESILNWNKLKKPEPSRFLSGHFIFCKGTFVTDVPYDPYLYFHGEETSLAARAYTHGYDLFHIHKPIIWHHYSRPNHKRHWDDSPKWESLNKKSFLRYRKLFGMDGEKKTNFTKYGFGKKRTLKDYEKYAGIEFSTRKIHKDTIDRKPPPVKYSSPQEYSDNLISQFKYCIDLHKSVFTENDYDVWVMAFKNKSGEEMVRLDALKDEVKQLLHSDPQDDFVRFWRQFPTSELPSKWLVWPHSLSKGWMEIIEGEVPVP